MTKIRSTRKSPPPLSIWARRLQALAQGGLTYSTDPYERERCEELQQIAAEMMASASTLPAEQWQALFQDETGYSTPKVDVRAAVFEADKILLSREQDDACWSLPGGWADVNDSPSEAVIRELKEETGYDGRCIKLAAVLDRDKYYSGPAHPFHIYKLLFLCEHSGGADELCHDITEAAFFDLNDLPPLSEHRTLPAHIQLLYRHHRNPDLPTVFD